MQTVFCFVFQKSELHILSNPVLLENSCFCTNPANIRNKAVSQVGHLLLSLKLIKLLFESFVIMHEQLQKAFNIRHWHICKKESCVGTFQNSQLSICPAKSALISTSFLKECFEACPSRLTGEKAGINQNSASLFSSVLIDWLPERSEVLVQHTFFFFFGALCYRRN